jgi:hypothetical protein
MMLSEPPDAIGTACYWFSSMPSLRLKPRDRAAIERNKLLIELSSFSIPLRQLNVDMETEVAALTTITS